MSWRIADGWLQPARRVPSPNQDDRPAATDISLIVIHAISLPPGQFGGPAIDDFFTNRLDVSAHPYFQEIQSLRVSAHLLIRRDGQVVQYVAFDKRAWHAGVSRYQGRERCNDFSIGIELEGSDEAPFAESQYQTLNALIPLLRQHYPHIDAQAIAGHCHVAPGRKTDPGPHFDWSRLGLAPISG